MEQFVVDKAAAGAVKRSRSRYEPDFIAEAVELARHIKPTAAVAQLNKKLPADKQLAVGTVDSWMSRYRKEGKFWESEAKRGRRAFLDSAPGLRDEWTRQVDAMRAQGASVSGRVSATIVKAVLEEKTPSLLERHGGHAKVSLRMGQKVLSAAGYAPRKKSSSRVLPPDDAVADARDTFYAALQGCFPDDVVDRHLLINFDQTFQNYHPTRSFTWEKKGAIRVQVKESKDGFTLLPVVSAGGIVGAQMIFDGKTAGSLPTIPSGPLMKYTQTPTHWSTEATTLELFRTIILPHIAARRAALGQPDAPAIVLADAFPPHWADSVVDLVAAQRSVAYVAVPETLTHLFQPLDLGIIAALKNSVMRRMDDFMEHEVRIAIQENRSVVLSKSRPVLRDRMATYIKECLADPTICAEHCCKAGFSRAGVLFALYGEGDRLPDVDALVRYPRCEECGEPAKHRDDMPECECFADGQLKPLCDGCHHNHSTLCVPASRT